MRKVQCTNMHYFDADSYQVCPHCGAPINTAGAPAPAAPEDAKGKSSSKFRMPFFGGHKDADKQAAPAPAPAQAPAPGGYQGYPQQQYPQAAPGQMPAPAPAAQSYQPVQPQQPRQPQQPQAYTPLQQPRPAAPQPAPAPAPVQARPVQPAADQHTVSILRANENKARQQAAEPPKPAPIPAAPVQMPSPPQAPSSVPTPSAADNGGKTIGFFNGGSAASRDPVVGWLVCLKGANFGASYELAARKNTIGRLYGNDVVLENEPQVSRESHAIINFDYKKADFYLLPSNGDSPYVNDEIVLAARKLESFDRIEIGGCLLLFVPLCGDNFSWSDYIDKE